MGFTIFLSWIEHRLFATVFTLELLFPIAILAILYDVCARTSCAVIGDNLLDHVLAYHQLALNHYRKGLKRLDGQMVQIVHFDYDFRLTETGLGLDFSCIADWVSIQSHKKFVKFHANFESEIHTLCYRSKVLPDLGWSNDCKPSSTFEDNFSRMLDADSYYYYSFLYPDIKFPISQTDL